MHHKKRESLYRMICLFIDAHKFVLRAVYDVWNTGISYSAINALKQAEMQI